VIHVWDTCTGQLNATLRANSAQPVLGVDMNGGLVAGCSCDKMCRIWNLKSKRMVRPLSTSPLCLWPCLCIYPRSERADKVSSNNHNIAVLCARLHYYNRYINLLAMAAK